MLKQNCLADKIKTMNKKKNKPVYNIGGFLNFIQGASPLLNAVMPGLGLPVGAAAGLAASQIEATPAPATYEPMTPNSNKYGLRKGGIYIKPENRGKFNATKKRTGKTTEELTHSKNPLTRKRAIFAQNAAKWNKADGGYLEALGADSVQIKAHNPGMTDSVELPQAFVDHNEVISRLSDGTKYVFPDDKVNPLTGNKYSKDAKALAKAIAKAEGKSNDPHAKNAIKHMEAQRNIYAATNEITNALIGGVKEGLKCGGPLKKRMQVGGPYTPEGPYDPNMPATFLPTATVTAPRLVNLDTIQVRPQYLDTVNMSGSGRPGYWQFEPENMKAGLISQNLTDRGSAFALPEGALAKRLAETRPRRYSEGNLQAMFPAPVAGPSPDPNFDLAAGRYNYYKNRGRNTDNSINPAAYMAGNYEAPIDNTYVAPQWDRTKTLLQGQPEKNPIVTATPPAGQGKRRAPVKAEVFPPAYPVRATATAAVDPIGSTLPSAVKSQTAPYPGSLAGDLASITNRTMPGAESGIAQDTQVGPAGGFDQRTNTLNRLGEFFQLAELGAKAGLMGRGYDKQRLYQNTAPINLRSFDPTSALQQSQYGYQTAQDQIRNTTSRASMMGNLQQAAANQARQQAQIATQYQQLNKQAATQYENQLAARQAENIQRRYATDQIRQQDEAAYFNNLDTLLTSVGNYGRAKVDQDYNQKAVQLVLQAFPDIAQYFKV